MGNAGVGRRFLCQIRFGNKVIEQWLASQGKSIKDFTAIDRLCYTGKRGMGALEYVPASSGMT